jgi:hypothetical protein
MPNITSHGWGWDHPLRPEGELPGFVVRGPQGQYSPHGDGDVVGFVSPNNQGECWNVALMFPNGHDASTVGIEWPVRSDLCCRDLETALAALETRARMLVEWCS